jgi:putative transposase
MKNKKRKSPQEKLAIIKEGIETGWVETARKHNISYPTLQTWRLRFESGGEAALSAKLDSSSAELKKLMRENQKLKELVAEKELVIRIKDDLLKKKKLNPWKG